MTRDEITALFDRRLEAFNAHEAAALADDFSDDARVESPLAGGTATGREAIERLYVTFFAAFTDLTLEQDELLVDGDSVSLLARMTGTDNGGFMGGPPTHRKVSFRVALFYTLREGQIIRERRVYDFTGVLIQVGLLKAKPV
jgi:steroid delta-isomerase-like uncharacterized protein